MSAKILFLILFCLVSGRLVKRKKKRKKKQVEETNNKDDKLTNNHVIKAILSEDTISFNYIRIITSNQPILSFDMQLLDNMIHIC